MNGEKSVVDEYTILKKDGATFPVLVQATAIYRGGRFEGHRGFVIDISEKKNLESQLSRSQKMEAIGTLAGGIAHDFNNLLMGILGNISLVLMKLDSNTQAYDRLKSVEEYVQRGSSLTNQLLGFARGGKYEVKLTDMGKFVKDIYRLFGRTRKDIRIFHKTQKGLRAVEVDQGQMERVLMNLFVNASHAMPGGGSLYLSEENIDLDRTQVSPYGLDPGRFISLCIRDTGTGMDEATKSRLFEPFFTTKERGQGTGLGLASAYGIVSNHGGFITVESEIGEGTTFTIYLPASDREIETTVKNTGKTTGGNETILLIDDENMILMLCADMLKELGYKVITAAGGISGIKLYENNIDEIDLVILDMIMPDINGREVYEAIIWMNPDAKILLSSGYSLDSQAKEIMDMGCRGFIQKPFVIADLSAKVREILDKE